LSVKDQAEICSSQADNRWHEGNGEANQSRRIQQKGQGKRDGGYYSLLRSESTV